MTGARLVLNISNRTFFRSLARRPYHEMPLAQTCSAILSFGGNIVFELSSMIEGYSPITQTLLGTGLTWLVTAIGAAFCALYAGSGESKIQHLFLDGSLGFSAGVMLAASFWSLLDPALSLSANDLELGTLAFVPVVIGLICGSLFVGLAELFIPHEWSSPIHADGFCNDMAEGDYPFVPTFQTEVDRIELANPVRQRKQKQNFNATFDQTSQRIDLGTIPRAPKSIMNPRLWLLIVAVTVHNIPEGLAVGIAFGAVGQENSLSTLSGARYGQLSGLVEPVAGLFGCLAVQFFRKLQPYALAFAAGAMLFVVFDDIIPEAQQRGNGRLASIAAMTGFILMMVLDVTTNVT